MAITPQEAEKRIRKALDEADLKLKQMRDSSVTAVSSTYHVNDGVVSISIPSTVKTAKIKTA